MANKEAITYEIDQLIAMNRDEDEEVELTHHPAENVTQTDAEDKNTSRRLTFGEYKTPAAAKARLSELNEQLQGLEATVEQNLENSTGGERGHSHQDADSSSDSDDLANLGTPINLQEAVLKTDTTGLPARITMTPQAILMGTIDLEELNPQFREIGENNCRSIRQAADWFRISEPSTKENPHQLDKLKDAAKTGGLPAIEEIQNTLTWLMSHKWNTTEAHAMVIHMLTEDAGKPQAGYANSISQLITMFSWMMPVDRKRFKTLTKQGKMDPTIGQITEGINKSKGFKWLDPSQTTTHKGTELHHSHAWVELLQAARNILHRPHENTQAPREAVSKWQSKHYKLTILGEECQGKWERQKKGEPIIVKLNEEMANYNAMVRACNENGAKQLIPSDADRNANLMTIPLLTTVKHVQKKLRNAENGPITILQARYDKLIKLIYDHDHRQEAEYWVKDTGEKKQSNDKLEKTRKDKPKPEKDPKEMAEALKNYAKANHVEIKDVKTSDLYKNGKSVRKWAQNEGEGYTAHAGAPAEQPDKSINQPNNGKRCRFYANGSCKKGDKCEWAHLEKYKEKQREATGHHMQEQANDEEDSSDGEPICWYVAPGDGFEYEEHSPDTSEDEEPWCGSGTTPMTGDCMSDSDDPHESMPIPSNDGHGETLEQLNTQCPWNVTDEPESDWSSSDQDEFTLPMQPEGDKEDSVCEGTKHHDKRLQRKFIKELQRGMENNWLAEGLRTSKVLYALHDWAQMHRRTNVGWKHWAHRHKQKALANIRGNYDQRRYEATMTAKVKNRLTDNALHDWTQMHRRRNLGGRHWDHEQMREAMAAIRNNQPDARKTKDAKSTKAVRMREAIAAVTRRRKKIALFTLRKNIIITANDAIKAMNAVFWAETRGRTRQLRRSWFKWEANNTRERRANQAIDAATHARGTTTAKQAALKTWRDWHRRMESLKSWLDRADWTVWEAKARQKIFYDWRMNSGLRAERYAWKGWPADGMTPETKKKWTEELIAGGIKHEYILLHWASTWHKRWSDASIKRRREALNTWRIKNSLREASVHVEQPMERWGRRTGA